MAIFPVLETESLVQENDKTRLNAVKSYVSGTTAITLIQIKPSKLGAFVDVTTAGYLDWEYPFQFEIDALNNKIDFSEGGGQLTATLTGGAYSPTALAAEIQTKLRAAGALLYVVTASAANAFSVSAPSAFSLLPVSGTNASAGILPAIGFPEDVSGAIAYVGVDVETIGLTASLKVTNAGGDKMITRAVTLVSETADHLFSSDDKLRRHESDILKYVPDGRATYKDTHRRAQDLILAWLDTKGYIDNIGDKITKKRVRDIDEVTEWATMMALRLIFEGLSNAIDDVFAEKAKRYSGLEKFYRDRAILRLDLNQDGALDVNEELVIQDCIVVRR